MLIVGQAAIEPFLQRKAARLPMARWIAVASDAEWHSILDARMTFRSADAIKGTNLTCFNIGGNRYRLLTVVSYQQQMISIVDLMTHAEYSRKFV